MQRNFFPEIFFEFSLGHAVKPVTAHLTTFIIISMFIRVIARGAGGEPLRGKCKKNIQFFGAGFPYKV